MLFCHFYLREDLVAPKKTMISPNPAPISRPSRTRLMRKPSNKPNTIANMKATSPLLKLGLRCSLMFYIQASPLPLFSRERGKG